MDLPALRAVSSRIDTAWIGDPRSSRALIVFNPHPRPVSGVARLPVDMSVRPGTPPPRGVAVRTPDGRVAPAEIAGFTESNTPGGRVRRRFDLLVAVEEVPARGYRTYVSEWASSSGPALPSPRPTEEELLPAVEEEAHPGDLPPEASGILKEAP